MVAQAVGNLIDNALKYATGRGAISVSTAMHGAGVAISVADNGPGIPEDQLDKVVQRFYRVDPSRVMPGAGLGLSQVEAVARLHGGALKLASNDPGLRATLFLHTVPGEH
jgi:signal transduction histidine kinase